MNNQKANKLLNTILFKHLSNNCLKLEKLKLGDEYSLIYLMSEEASTRASLEGARKIGNFYFFDYVKFAYNENEIFYFDRTIDDTVPYRHITSKFKYKCRWWVLPIEED